VDRRPADAGDVDGAERADGGSPVDSETRARGPGARALLLRGWAGRLCVAATGDDHTCELPGHCAGADSAQAGEQIKTNRRDARKLAELLRAGLLTEVRPPTLAEEAVRDLCRARDDAREDLQRCRHRLGKLFLRRGLHYSGRNWTRAHRRWVDSLEWTQPAERVVVDDYLLAIDHVEARLLELDTRLMEIAQTDPYREPVGWLRCFRGIDTLTAILLLAELHDFRRFPNARALMAYLGLVPGEDSTGEHHRRGRITKTGNALVRRLLVETAWHYQHRPSVGVALARRRKGQPGRVIAIADKAQQRLCRRFRRLAEHHKPAPKIAVAIARELAGFLWAGLQPAPATS
jgi:transposase